MGGVAVPVAVDATSTLPSASARGLACGVLRGRSFFPRENHDEVGIFEVVGAGGAVTDGCWPCSARPVERDR